jgi:hypothetical protein
MSPHKLRIQPIRHAGDPVESRPDLATVRRLQQVRGFPALSILLSTSPSDGLTGTDALALDRLVAEAAGRLQAEAGALAADLGNHLRSLAIWAASMPTERALALYLHTKHSEIVRLPTPVRNRVVVAETFATGDLVTAFRHAPHYLLLHLGGATTRLFDGYGRRLEERNADEFRAVNPWRGASNLRAVGFDVDASVAYAARQRSYLRRVDAALDAVEPSGAVPLVLTGDSSLCAAFAELTTHPERVVGVIRADELPTGLDALGRLAGRLMASHRSRLEQEALAAVDSARLHGRVAGGIADVWRAVIRAEGQTLLVEESTVLPARITGDGLGLRPAAPEGGRGVVADVIGELAWAVAFYGGDVTVVPGGALAAFDGIALILRSPRSADTGVAELRRLTPGGA